MTGIELRNNGFLEKYHVCTLSKAGSVGFLTNMRLSGICQKPVNRSTKTFVHWITSRDLITRQARPQVNWMVQPNRLVERKLNFFLHFSWQLPADKWADKKNTPIQMSRSGQKKSLYRVALIRNNKSDSDSPPTKKKILPPKAKFPVKSIRSKN